MTQEIVAANVVSDIFELIHNGGFYVFQNETRFHSN